jgi:NAD(P)-dependent dehydrogenase (short-subunit alcohol dehydrogenase family)
MIDKDERRVAIVTGASRGIGRAVACAPARAGLDVFLVADGTQQELEAACSECAAVPNGQPGRFGMFDLAQPDCAPRVIEAALKAFGRVDVLVNNAGIRIRHPFGQFTAAEFDAVVAVNLRAAFLLSQAVLPAMRAQRGGRIINIASQLGMVADPGSALYGITKAGLIHLTRSMAYELGREGILVHAVSPGPILTEFYKQRLQREPDLLERRMARLPVGRLGEPEEIAEVVAFLATTQATYMTGGNIVIDGGYVTH